VRVGILDRDLDDITGLEVGSDIAQEDLPVDLRRVGLAAARRADIAILVRRADLRPR